MSLQTPDGTPLEEFSSEQKDIDGEDLGGRNVQRSGNVVDDFYDNNFFEHRNVDDILRRVSAALAGHIRAGERLRDNVKHSTRASLKLTDSPNRNREALMFSKRYDEEFFVKLQRRYTVMQYQSISPFSCFISAPVMPSHKVPSADKIFRFLRKIFKKAQLDGECAIICLVYMERLMRTQPLHLLATNWRPLTMAGVLIAAKMSQDIAPANKHFQAIYPAFSIKAIKELEGALTRLLEWHLQVKPEVYQKYHIALRNLGANVASTNPKPPLSWAPRGSGYHLRKSKLYTAIRVTAPKNESLLTHQKTNRMISSSV